MSRRRLPYLLVLVGIVALDQLAKRLVVRFMEPHDYYPLIDGLLSISHVRNRGAAFGILSDAQLPFQAVLFAVLSLVALVAIAVYALRLSPAARLPQYALALVLGGAVGNLIDRVRLGYVIDFIHLYWQRYQWPDFNVADSAITVGVSLLILDILRASRGGATSESKIRQAASPAGRTE